MRQSGSIDSFASSRVLSVLAGVPLFLCILASPANAAQAQRPVQANSAVPATDPTDCLRDHDGDGLDDALEAGQSTSADRVDSDYDGWNDAEELARGSLGSAPISQPDDHLTSVGARAYVRGGKLHIAAAAYIRSGSLQDVHLKVGVFASGRMIPLPPTSYGQSATLTTVPTKNPGELLVVTDIIVPSSPLYRTGKMSIYVTLQVGDFLRAGDAINLELHDDTPMELIGPAQMAPNALEQLGPGLLRRPLGGTQPPIQWQSGEVCFQRLECVGMHGAVVTQEVTTASCISGWDGYCDGGACASSVGSTVDIIDPAALVGG